MIFHQNRPKFLTEEECNRTINRLQNDAGPGASEIILVGNKFVQHFLDWKIYVFCLCYIGIVEPFYSLSLFSHQQLFKVLASQVIVLNL